MVRAGVGFEPRAVGSNMTSADLGMIRHSNQVPAKVSLSQGCTPLGPVGLS